MPRSVQLADICDDVSYGFTASATDENTGTRFLRITDIQGGKVNWDTVPFCQIDPKSKEKNLLCENDIVVARTGNSTGENYLFSGIAPAVFASYLIRFRVDPTTADPKFVWYQMRSKKWWDFINGAKTGSAQAGANAKVLGSYELHLPARSVQKAIAHILGTLDDKIELNQKMNQSLEDIAKAIFKSWFVDFDPVRAKIEGRPTGLSPEIDELFPDELVDSEIGEIPKGWNQVEVADLCDYVSSGGTPARKTKEYWINGDIDWFKTGELLDRPLLDASEKITNLGVEKSAAKLWQRHTILFAIYASPTVGRLGYLTSPGTCNQAAAGLVAKKGIGMPFLYWTLFNARKELQNIAVGAAQQNINVGILKEHKCLEPTHDLITIFSEFGLVIEKRRELIERENRVLSELRDTLLPKLISGELRIPDAEKFLEEAGI